MEIINTKFGSFYRFPPTRIGQQDFISLIKQSVERNVKCFYSRIQFVGVDAISIPGRVDSGLTCVPIVKTLRRPCSRAHCAGHQSGGAGSALHLPHDKSAVATLAELSWPSAV